MGDINVCNACSFCHVQCVQLPLIQPEEGSISTSVTVDNFDTGKAGMLKCSLQQCKSTYAWEDLSSCCYQDCGKNIHCPCYMAFLMKNSL
jgi:hypothetical protein